MKKCQSAADPGASFLEEVLHPQLHKDDSIKLSQEEAHKFKEAFANDNFRKLMAEYVSEISDPKHRAEQDAYIRQLEEQNEIPAGKKIIRPKPGFVIKFKHVKQRSKCAEKMKIFVNIVYSDQVEKPKSVKAQRSLENIGSQKGQQWTIPYNIGPLKMEEDKGKLLVPTIDCCFHPDSLVYALKSPAFRDLVSATAREALEKVFSSMNDEIIVENDYHIMRGVSYKIGTPPAMLVGDGDTSHQDKDPHQNAGEKINRHCMASSKKYDTKEEVTKGSKGRLGTDTKKVFHIQDTKITRREQTEQQQEKKRGSNMLGGGNAPNGKVVPYYHLVEQSAFKISDHALDEKIAITCNRPEKIILRIMLPRIIRVSDIDLDISEKRIILQSSFYYLDINISYPIVYEDGKAKFDGGKRVLTLTIPVCNSGPLIAMEPAPLKVKEKEDNDAAKKKIYNKVISKEVKTENKSDASQRKNMSHQGDHLRWLDPKSMNVKVSSREEFAKDEILSTCNNNIIDKCLEDRKIVKENIEVHPVPQNDHVSGTNKANTKTPRVIDEDVTISEIEVSVPADSIPGTSNNSAEISLFMPATAGYSVSFEIMIN